MGKERGDGTVCGAARRRGSDGAAIKHTHFLRGSKDVLYEGVGWEGRGRCPFRTIGGHRDDGVHIGVGVLQPDALKIQGYEVLATDQAGLGQQGAPHWGIVTLVHLHTSKIRQRRCCGMGRRTGGGMDW
jgi:hypothetical protein